MAERYECITDNYSVNFEKSIGKGSFGVVYEGINRKSLQKIAAKKLTNTFDAQLQEMGKRLSDEINCLILGNGHPNIVKFFDISAKQDYLWIFMEYCKHGDLLSYVKTLKKSLPEELLLRFLLEAGESVTFLHQQKPPVVHGDIKLNTFLVQDEEGRPVIKLDFGLVKMLPEDDIERETVAGNIYFKAPEFFMQDVLRYDLSVDIFSLGLVFQVLINYDGRDDFLQPLAAEMRRKNIMLPYGQHIALALKGEMAMPELFEHCATDSEVRSQLKELTEEMVQPKALDRKKAQQVRDDLQKLQLVKKSLSIHTLVSKPLTIHRTHPLPEFLRTILMCHGELFCLMWENGSIEVYNPSSGEHMRTVTTGLRYARSMTITKKHHLLIATAEGLLQYDVGGAFEKCLNNEPHLDVANVSNGAVALRVKDGMIHIDHYNNKLQRISQTPTAMKKDDNRYTCALASGSFYICSSGEDQIYTVDIKTGNVLQKYGCSGDTQPGELNCPLICCNDGKVLLIADCGNSRLQTLDCETSQWKVLDIEGLDVPRSAVVDDDGVMFVSGGWYGRKGPYTLYIISR